MFLLNDIKVCEREQRTIGTTQYPAGWFLNPLERAKVGMIEVPDIPKPDDNLFTSVENPDGSWTATPRTDTDIAERIAAKIKADIAALEEKVTPRRTREAILAIDTVWLADVELQIGQLRQQLAEYDNA